MNIEILGERLHLLPAPAVFWPRRNVLLIADLHLGKDVSFRAGSIAVPTGPSQSTLQRWSKLIQDVEPSEVIVLGDYVHARNSLSESLSDEIHRFHDQHTQIAFKLILGNHDRTSLRRLADLPIEMVAPPYLLDPFWLVHDCETEMPTEKKEGASFAIGGHLHPAIQIQDGSFREKVRCFFQTEKSLTLPAFGAFTGTKAIRPTKEQSVYVVLEDRVIEWKQK